MICSHTKFKSTEHTKTLFYYPTVTFDIIRQQSSLTIMSRPKLLKYKSTVEGNFKFRILAHMTPIL